ncbi:MULTISPECIES: winged helix-turn-helix domain-containing protein [Klebsiella]|uniref:winged helix-turn-helix domain-containing protein n=1 Tax=Klebsiella TaxID=570 RepID=UPI000B40D252|nr:MULTISPECIES: winged helix-turn-helix domain-containing protein [Klebsiella]ELA2276471.1 winged helix-turn-helix domain-containing protein [Klebsiella aerogenes]ELT7620310.1 winged helix-turn-helix domain-containing protein [Klebsiella aerogenes]ELY3086557.1 winged helix-turn-helix domain-containing protein [Klebsiella aerogenes]MDQ8579844.1 winged helix-turn-helix domain-containing protein [Klebsiella aerogenes]MDU9367356.1 winged helix-turn-helix domain-containing protein [Klebsiella sp. 
MAFSEFIINDEVIFDVNMSELRTVNENGTTVNLNGPTARCLLLLIESNGRIISREEFLETVWKTRGVIVAQNTFYQNISLLRKSLVKAGLSQDIIITVRQRGFILATDAVITPVTTTQEIIASPSTNVDDSASDRESIESEMYEVKNTVNANRSESRRGTTFKLPKWIVVMFIVMVATNILSLLF